jgi:hypothetical protein
LALALTAIVGAGLYRIGEWLLKDRSAPDSATIIFLVVVATLGCGLWPLAFRLLRGAGSPHAGDGTLFGPTGFRVAALFFLLSSALVVWIALDAHVYWPLALALVGVTLTVLALRRAQSAAKERQPG